MLRRDRLAQQQLNAGLVLLESFHGGAADLLHGDQRLLDVHEGLEARDGGEAERDTLAAGLEGGLGPGFGGGGRKRLGGCGEPLQQLRHELREAVQVVDQAVQGARQVGELAGELGALRLLLGELRLQALGKLLDGGPALRQFLAGSHGVGGSGIVQLMQRLREQAGGAGDSVVSILGQAYPLTGSLRRLR